MPVYTMRHCVAHLPRRHYAAAILLPHAHPGQAGWVQAALRRRGHAGTEARAGGNAARAALTLEQDRAAATAPLGRAYAAHIPAFKAPRRAPSPARRLLCHSVGLALLPHHCHTCLPPSCLLPALPPSTWCVVNAELFCAGIAFHYTLLLSFVDTRPLRWTVPPAARARRT